MQFPTVSNRIKKRVHKTGEKAIVSLLSSLQSPPSKAYPGCCEQQSLPRADPGFLSCIKIQNFRWHSIGTPRLQGILDDAVSCFLLLLILPQSSLCYLYPLSSWSGQALEREKHVLIGRQHLCILNSMLVNQNELKRSGSGLRVLKISPSIC